MVLGVETSCDETGIGIVIGDRLCANVIASSVDEQARFGGVVPEVARRAHVDAWGPALDAALDAASAFGAAVLVASPMLTARERERAGRRTYRLVYGGRFGAWPVLSGRALRSAPRTDLREGDGAVAPGGAATPRGGWVHVVAVKRADGTEEEPSIEEELDRLLSWRAIEIEPRSIPPASFFTRGNG